MERDRSTCQTKTGNFMNESDPFLSMSRPVSICMCDVHKHVVKKKPLSQMLPHDNHDYIQETQLEINKMALHYRQLMGSAILNNS